ncbi:ABC transporter substrate-binding protein [Granulosicoccus sp.]|nr:ABC transporter substrate-binding protein [Granulosicoccus sp.]MDB4222697.1 ABC transporter substrate-binding protein [Granulosicoccus sp.]
MNFRKSLIQAVTAAALTVAGSTVQAADEVNVGYFLEWATPNQVAKVLKTYDDEMGVPVNWTNFDAGTQMTEAMLSGDIDISFSQGLAPFINAVNANAPIKLVAIAVQYPANDCFVANGAGIDSSNASELEGTTVAVPLATMADYSFRMMMRALDVDVSTITVVDQLPADGAVSLADGSVTMACSFGGIADAKNAENGVRLMTSEQKDAAGIISFDVVSVTEKFMQESPDLLETFLDVTDAANTSFGDTEDELLVIASDAGMSVEDTRAQMATMTFPSAKEQLEKYFNDNGLASAAIAVVGNAFATAENPALEDYSVAIDTSFLK